MSHTFTQLYLHIIFSVKYKEHLLMSNDKVLHKYIHGIINKLKCKMLEINNMPDHIHILVSKNPNISEAELLRKIKANSSRWLKYHLNNNYFRWQTGYASFSYNQSNLSAVKKYIQNQQIHHKTQDYEDEIIKAFNIFEIEFDEKSLNKFFPE